MKQIDKIIFHNFQCHPHSVIKLAPSGLTVITGPTDHGKSAMVRGLKWLFYNRPQGDDFIRHGESECKVIAVRSDDIRIIRRRTKSLNQYIIKYPGDKEDDLFEGFGNTVPMEIQRALGIYNYEIADETLRLNIAEQLAGPFLGSSISAPTRAKILGKLAGTEAIDKAQKELHTDVYHGKQKKSALKNAIFDLNEDIEKYSWVPALGETLEKAEKIFEQIKQKRERLERLNEIKDKLHDLKAKEMELDNNLTLLMHVDEAIKINKTIRKNINIWTKLKNINDEWHKLTDRRGLLELNLLRLPNPDIINKKLDNIDYNSSDKTNLTSINKKLSSIKKTKLKLKNNHGKLQQVYKANEVIQSAIIKQQRLVQMDKIDNSLSQLQLKDQKINTRLDQVGIVDHVQKIIESIEFNQNELTDYKNQLINIKHINQNIEQYRKSKEEKAIKIEKVKQIAEQSRKKYEKLLNELGICPTCGSKVNKNDLERVI